MRGVKAKACRKLAFKIYLQAQKEDAGTEASSFLNGGYLHNPNNGQIICGGYRGITRAIKKMYRENMEVAI